MASSNEALTDAVCLRPGSARGGGEDPPGLGSTCSAPPHSERIHSRSLSTHTHTHIPSILGSSLFRKHTAPVKTRGPPYQRSKAGEAAGGGGTICMTILRVGACEPMTDG